MIVQIARRLVQTAALLVIAALPLLSLYAHYRAAGSIDDPDLMVGLRGETLTRAIHPVVEQFADPQTLLDSNKGTLWSMRLFGIDLTDPLAAAEMIAASKQIHWPLLSSIIIPIALTLALGKVFCSWICPGYLLFELTGKLRGLLRFAEIQPGGVRFAHRNKYLFLVVGLAVAAAASAPLFALIYPPAVISRVMHAWIFGTALTGMVVLLLIMVAFELLVSPRWWCRTMCPGGALYGLLGWARLVRVRLRDSGCTGCMDCLPVCEAGINPITDSSSIECDNCGVCVRHCGDRALYYTIALPKFSSRGGRRKRGAQRAHALVATLVGLSVFFFAGTARGHHILGLPHYSYKENYPQRPTLEYPAQTGPYDVMLTSYPGVPIPGEPSNLAFYIKDRDAGRVYDQPISLRVLKTSTFGDNEVIIPPTPRTPFDNEYKYHVAFPEDGEYIVELSMPVEGRVEIIRFLMIAGEPTAVASLVVTGAFGMTMLFVVIRAVQKKRRRAGRRLAVVQKGRVVRAAASAAVVEAAP